MPHTVQSERRHARRMESVHTLQRAARRWGYGAEADGTIFASTFKLSSVDNFSFRALGDRDAELLVPARLPVLRLAAGAAVPHELAAGAGS